MSDPPEFEWHDAWVLAAVIYATEGAAPVPLWRVIGIADALNKAIVTRSELEHALTRLDRAGYVRAVPGGFEATPAALALKAPGHPMEHVAQAIGAKPWSPDTEVARAPEVYVTTEAYTKAEKKYRKEFWKQDRGR